MKTNGRRRRVRSGPPLLVVLCALVMPALLAPLSGEAVAGAEQAPLGSPEGFGQHTTGGAGGDTYWVTTLGDSGPGSLREGAMSPDPLVIRFSVPGWIKLQSPLHVGPDKTIDGRDAKVAITRFGLVLAKPNVIVENLLFSGIGDVGDLAATQDAILVDGASDVWIDHNTITKVADKAIGLDAGTDVTVSWNRFRDQRQVIQIGCFGCTDALNPADARVTVHHNLFDGDGYRQPRVSYGKLHAYDNYVANWSGQGMSSVRGAELLSQSNVFQAGDKVNAIVFDGNLTGDKDATFGYVRSEGDLLLKGAQVLENEPQLVFDPADYYTASVEPATLDLRDRLKAGTGRH
jgi:pectate lyase